MSNANDDTFPAAMHHPCYLQIPAHSLRRATEFYQKVFEVDVRNPKDVDSTEDRAAIHIEFPGASLRWGGIIKLPGTDASSTLQGGREHGFGVLYFRVKDIEEKIGELNEAGAVMMTGKVGLMDGEAGYYADFRDPEGNFFGVYEPPAPGTKYA